MLMKVLLMNPMSTMEHTVRLNAADYIKTIKFVLLGIKQLLIGREENIKDSLTHPSPSLPVHHYDNHSSIKRSRTCPSELA
ncbi:MAG: hypothetical protein KGQ16_06145 [Cyanobacteria bacterium REEB444]|nr:hypothetical protein [Cyanobacteria bacterium REEB444]